MIKHVLAYTLATLIASTSCFSQNIDIDLLRKINIDRNNSLDPFFHTLSNSAYFIGLAAPTTLYSIGLIKKENTVKKRAIYIGETLLASSFISLGLKYSINRTRPFKTYPDIEKLSVGGGPSFPSAHTSNAFAVATSLSIVFPKWYVITPSFLWAGAVGYSRMHLGVHYPSDVLVGAIVGSASAYFTWKLNRWIEKRYF